MESNTKDLNSIYILKAIAALLVVCNHIPNFLFPDLNNYNTNGITNWYDLFLFPKLEPIIRLAVPIFLMISGFFIYKNNDTFRTSLKKSIIKVLKIIIIVNSIYILAYTIGFHQFPIRSWNAFFNIILFGTSLSPHLWYLNAFLGALVFFYVISFITHKNKWIYFLPLLFFLHLLVGRYQFITGLSDIPLYIRLNFLTVGIPCFSIGIICKLNSDMLKKHVHAITICTIVFLIMIYFESFILSINNHNNLVNYLLLTLPLSVSLFLMFLHLDINKKNLFIKIGKNDSANIYYWHILINIIISHFILIKSIQAFLIYFIAIVTSMTLNKLIHIAHKIEFTKLEKHV